MSQFLGRLKLTVLRIKKLSLSVIVLLGCLYIMFTFKGSINPAYSADSNLVRSYGSGPYQMLIFSDYFCQPCQQLEKELDGAIHDIIAGGGVKVSFVDLPIYKLTPLYANYFLYAVNASKSFQEVLLARKALFDVAWRVDAITEPQLENALKSRNIPLKPHDVKPVLMQYDEIIKKCQVRGTPTFVFVYSPTDVRKYTGGPDIKKGLSELRKALGRP
jgi:thioredoxin-related protein